MKFCQKNGIKEKDSLWSDKRIKYVRSGDFVDFIRENLKDVKKLVEDFEWKNDGNDDDMHKFLKYLMDWRILLRFERYEDPVDKKVYKYPKRLLYNP